MIRKNPETPRLNSTESSIFRLAKPYLQARNNELHARNAIEFAFRLLTIYKADRYVIIPAMILHDVGWSVVPEEIIKKTCRPHPDKNLLRIHEGESLKIARDILKKVGYDTARTAEILEIIDGHDSRRGALSINDQIVQDSDKLTRYAGNFLFLVRQLPMTTVEFAISLEQLIDQWFFLPDSKEMARAELVQRRIEIDS
ncbi:MAG: HD domain-containing protein [Proteobacteria bacterium]|nr:HD domain-containing protein [Pseudomonadota bacterium]